MKNILAVLALLFCFSSGFAQECDINPHQAMEYHGKEATVCGEISQVYQPEYTKGNPVYLNMGQKFPNHSFTVVIWGDRAENFEMDLTKLAGKKVAITGIVREYDGKSQIVVKNESQIKMM